MTPLPLLLVTALAVADAPAAADYLRDVKPVLAARCYACHGAIQQKGGLRVDTARALREGGDSGPAVTPGEGEASLLVRRVLGRDGLSRMPPAHDGDALKPDQVTALRRWIDAGATAPADEQPEADPQEHWAFNAPVRPAAPRVKNQTWVRNPVDAFLAREHERLGLTPQPPADSGLLLRRLYLDLVGLPPTPEEIAHFELRIAELRKQSGGQADGPNLQSAIPQLAIEEVVDRLLDSPQYGERWGRHWLDVWRYSDWWGLGQELRNSQKHIWHWRDWAVESLNRDKGYDRLILEMLAADELFPADADALRGTGFLARHYFKFNRTTWLDETIEHTAKAFLGLTMNCAKCHDHKYDPVSQKDYYRFRAIFEPYQVRLDQVPGQADFEKGGVPRVFDCNLDAPTYLHVRGNEAQPDKARSLRPGLPRFFAVEDFSVTPVELPPEAYHPGLREFVLRDHLTAAEKELADARREQGKARQQLDLAAKKAAEPAPTAAPAAEAVPAHRDDFGALNPQLWDVGAGEWRVEGGKVAQKQDGDTRAVLTFRPEVPQDFEARFHFAIQGGRQWRSVGLVFDEGPGSEYLVYLTAHRGEPRVQVSYKAGGTSVYPPQAKQPRAVPLDQTQEMLLRVRGTLLNVAVNGGPTLAYTLPQGRRGGRLSLITFDARARFERFTLAALPPDVPLTEAGTSAASPVSLPQARAAVAVADKLVEAAGLNLEALKARAAADRALAYRPDAPNTKDLVRQAARAEKLLAVARAELDVASAGQEAAGKDDAPKLKQARAALAAAVKAAEKPGDVYTPLPGALKTLESNLETEASRRKPFPKVSTGRRSALAKWVADRRNPLTARVAVNHVWARHFGQPLVPTVFDFGRKGSPPTHPELLDWLAVEFMEHGWSLKHLHRLLVTSNAYRMTSSALHAPPANAANDRDNSYYWRMNPRRMEAQAVRDSLLHLAGELDLTRGGPPVEGAARETSRRRGLYFFHSAIDRSRFLTTFDDADPLDCYRRRESIVPQQALALSNSKLALDAATKIARRLQPAEKIFTDRDFIRRAFVLLLGYEPNGNELSACEQALAEWRAIYRTSPADATERARAALVHALLNHNDFVTIR